MITLFWVKDGREDISELSVLSTEHRAQCSYSTVQLQHSAVIAVGWQCRSKVLRFLCVQAQQGKAVGGN